MFLVLLIILIGYILLIEAIHQRIIVRPSQFQYEQLEKIYSSKVYCPCSSISMNYSTFINIELSFHQLCSSDMVSDRWIDYVNRVGKDLFANYFSNDYRLVGASHFQLLSVLCQHAERTVNTSLETFFQTKLVTSKVISQERFEAEMKSSFENWKSQTLEKFLRTIKIFRAIIHGNQLMSKKFNCYSCYLLRSGHLEILMEEYSNCSCVFSPSCVQRTGIADDTVSNWDRIAVPVPNFFLGCFPIEALSKSTLECFYNQSCMTRLDRYMRDSVESVFNFSSLNNTLNSPNETIESILNKLFIDSWSLNVSFSSYYDTCNPTSCTYEYTGRNELFIVITTVLGILGGLSLGLKLFTLIILRSLEKLTNNISFGGIIRVAKNLFLCDTEQRLINRLHFIFLLTILFLIFTWTAFKTKLVTVELTKPSLSDYKYLLRRYSKTVQCSCSQISMPYETFLNIEPRSHHLCSSQFISDEWIHYLYEQRNRFDQYLRIDSQSSAPFQFILLASLCEVSQEKIEDSLSELLKSHFINSQLLSSSTLNYEIQIILNRFQSTISNSLINILNLIREVMGSNMILSTLSTNWGYVNETAIIEFSTVHTAPINYGDCSCGLSWKCTQTIENLTIGCYALEGLLQTKLQCFYDQDCIDSNGNFRKLDISTLETSKFDLNSTIQSLLNNLMIEEYRNDLSYENYFDQCSPLSCQYSYLKSHDVTETITSLISLYGGLEIITYCIAIIIAEIYRHHKSRINPETIQENTL